MVSPPRIGIVPAGAVTSRGAEAVELARGAGLVLTAEQQQVLHGGLGVKADGSWAALEVANVQPRQNGKSSTLQARILLALKGGGQVAYTCHRVDSAQEVFRALVTLVEASPELAPQLDKVVYSNGKEAIWLGNGARVVFGTRSSRTGRGFGIDLLVLDEAHYLATEAHTALMPTMSARETPPQVWYAASAVDELVHEHGLVLARLRARAFAGDADSLAYFEWSLALYDEDGIELRPEQVTPEMVADEKLWEPANPALGSRISLEHLRAERAAMDFRGWLVERLGIGAWPDVSAVEAAPISGEEWADLCDRQSQTSGEIVLAFDVGRDRHAALVVCGRRGADDLLHVELLRSDAGTAWLREQLEYLAGRYEVRTVACDDYGGNRALLPALEQAGLPVRTLSGAETVSACARLLDLTAEQGFRHLGQPALMQSLRGAKTKTVGNDAWCWSRKASSGDASVVIAMTVALAVGLEIPVDDGELVIW